MLPQLTILATVDQQCRRASTVTMHRSSALKTLKLSSTQICDSYTYPEASLTVT
jgi:hypothetical protein